ncbi:MAG: protein kinase domain-containing protein [Candidatus Woesearchaeota archaeon]
MARNIDDTLQVREWSHMAEQSGKFKAIDIRASSADKHVYIVKDLRDNGIKALKIFKHRQQGSILAWREFNLYRELNERSNLDHIVRILEPPLEEDFPGVGLLMERAEYSLYEHLLALSNNNVKITTSMALDWLYQIVVGLDAVAKVGASHNDMKPENVLVFKGPKGSDWLKVTDFESSSKRNTGSSTRFVTEMYCPPEGWERPRDGSIYSTRYDIYTCGLMLAKFLSPTLSVPFEGVGGNQKNEKKKEPDQGTLKLFLSENGITGNPANLILKCCMPKARDRFQSFEELLDSISGKSIEIKPMLDYTDVDDFRKRYEAGINLMASKKFRSSKYGTATLENIDLVERTRIELEDLEKKIRASDLSKHDSDLVQEIEVMRQNYEATREKAALYDSELLYKSLNEMKARIASAKKTCRSKGAFAEFKMKEARKVVPLLADFTKIAFCWGPPFTTPNNQREDGKGRERYSLVDINNGKYLEALSNSAKQNLRMI